jgi:methyl-accepting chemotaxis protein
VGTLNSVSQELLKGANAMKEGSSGIADATGRISDVSSSVDSATEEIRKGIHEINTAMRHVADIDENLGVTAHDLDAKVSRFKTSSGNGRRG